MNSFAGLATTNTNNVGGRLTNGVIVVTAETEAAIGEGEEKKKRAQSQASDSSEENCANLKEGKYRNHQMSFQNLTSPSTVQGKKNI